MKKIIGLLLFAVLLTVSLAAITPAEDGYVYTYRGDMNQNGEADLADVLMILRGYLDGNAPAEADTNADGKVTIMDAVKMLRATTGSIPLPGVPNEKYLPVSHLENFSVPSVSLATDGLSATVSARYVEGGIEVTVTAKTKDYTKDSNVGVYLQGLRSIERADRRCIFFTAYANGSYKLQRRLYEEDGFAVETLANPTTKNNDCYYTYTKSADGFVTKIFASYAFLNVTEAQAYGNMRLFPRITVGSTTVQYDQYGAYYSQADTWLVCDTDGNLVRRDFDTVSFAEDIDKDSEYASLEFLSSLATIAPADGQKLFVAGAGAPLFSDRAYAFEESGFPKELCGKAYLYAPIGGGTVTVTEAGYVVLLAGENSIYDARNKKVIAGGFTPLILQASTPMNFAATRDNADLGNWYVKYCEVGETVNFGKWTVPFGNGETSPFPWQTTPATVQRPTDSYYALSERNWQGVPTLAVTNGGRLFASWVTGGTAEPRIENYDTFAYSDDGGKTWVEYGVIDTYKATDANKITKISDAQMWVDNETNTLYVFYLLSGAQHSNFEKNSGVWVFTVDNPDAPAAEWNFSEHWYCFPGLLRNNITVLSDGTWLAAPNYYMDGRFAIVYASADRGKTWTERGRAYIPQALNFDETVLTELADGSVWMTVRTARGAIYQSFSFDKGATWTLGVASEHISPSTRSQVFRTASGALCTLRNNHASERLNLVAQLSYDEGETWTEPLLIYAPKNSYPDFSIGSDGVIHVIVDSGRYKSGNSWADRDGSVLWGALFHIALTEERIAAGGHIENDELNVISVCREAPAIKNRNLLPMSYLTDFCESSITVAQKAKTTATATYTAAYGDTGVTVTATVVDPTVYTVADEVESGDGVTVILQGTSSVAFGDRFAVRFFCDGGGSHVLQRYDNSGGFAADNTVDPTKKNDSCYYTFAKTADGYTVTYFASYAFLRMTKEQAFGNVRVLLALRNTDSADNTAYFEYGTDLGVHPELPYTWLQLTAENRFVRGDFDTVSFAEDILPSNAYADLAFLDNLATISAGANSTLREAKPGAQVFNDRTYSFEQSFLPAELVGKAFVGAPIKGDTTTVTKAGYVVLAVGELSSYDALNTKVQAAGWTQILYAAGTPYNSGVRVNAPDLVNWYVKYCEAGEKIAFGKWAVPFANGETTPFAWDAKGAEVIIGSTDPYYGFDTRLWNGCPSVEVTSSGRIFAAWTTGGKSEGYPENYIVFAYSDDGGVSWKEFCVVNNGKADDPDKTSTVCDIQLWLDKETETIHCFYINTGKNPPYEKGSAVWTFTMRNLNGDVRDIEYSEHRYAFPGLARNNITVLSDGTWLIAPNSFLDERYCVVYASTDKGETWTLRSRVYVPEALNYDETMVTELADGTLWMGVRASTSKKAMYQAFSFDKGYTWTVSSPSHIFNCNTRFNFTRLESGALLMVYNAESGRKKMTAALSYDEGLSWPYRVTLYEAYSTYPDVSLYYDEDGGEQIHIIFDRDRYEYGQIFHVTLTEEYIRENNGKVLSPETDLHLVTTLK